MESDYIDRFCIKYSIHCVLKQVLLDSDPLGEVDSWKEVVRPSKKPNSVGQRKSKSAKSKEDKPEE